MNETLKLLTSHRSYRQFDETYTLSTEELEQILAAARQAPSWMNGQFYSIIVLTDPKIRQEFVRLNPGNPHIEKSSVFLLFVADLYRTEKVAQQKGTDYRIDGLDPLITATTDAALALENALVATESLGLGAVPVGSVRNYLSEIKALLDLPKHVLPIAGLSIGKPIVEMKIKPRLPKETVVHYNGYTPLDYTQIEDYDDTMRKFGEARETKDWTQKFADYFAKEPNRGVDDFIRTQKIAQKKTDE